MIGLAQAIPAEEHPRTALLPRLYVHPDHWREGIGTPLLGTERDRLRDRGVDRPRLTVLADNHRGCAFSEAHGFERVDAREDSRLALPEYVSESRL